MKAEPLVQDGIPFNSKRWCRFVVDISRIGTSANNERLRLARIKNLGPNACGLLAESLVDGEPYCRRHAGELLLSAQIGPARRKVRRW